jgi:uncharacterized protein (TIGR02265 family)
MTNPNVVFRHTVDAFVRNVLERHKLLTPEFRALLQSRGFDPLKVRDAPRETWWWLLQESARRLQPDRPAGETLELIGREMIRGYAHGVVGVGLFLALRLLGPRRAILRMAENFRTADTFSRVIVRELGPNHLELDYSPTAGMPELVKGILSESMLTIGLKNPSVEFRSAADDAAVFTLRW